jgi:hypothetical protein
VRRGHPGGLGTRLRYLRFSRGLRRTVLLCVGGLVGLGIVWLAVTGLVAMRQAARLETRLSEVKVLVAQGRIADAQKLARDIPTMARRAHRLTTGPAWWIGAHIPYLGGPLGAARDMTAAGDELGSAALPALMRVATKIDPTTLRASGSTIRLAPLAAARPGLARAAASIAAADRSLRGRSGTWLGPVDTRRAELAREIRSIAGYVDAAARVSRVLPSMLGQSGTKRYFIGLQNEAELRGTGGLPGAFTIASVTHGTVRFTRFESDSVLLATRSRPRLVTGLDFGSQYDAAYGNSSPTTSYTDSNVSPNFPYAAQIWAAMWRKVSGQRVDGVAAVDPTTLGYFLDVVGPTTAGGQVITGQNVVALTERDEYAIFADNAARKAFLVAVLKASAHKLTSGSGSALGIVRATSRAASERRLVVWTRDAATEKVLEQSHFAGNLPHGARPFSGLILNNTAAGKLDYYLSRSLAYSRTGCGPARDVVATITLTNSAPASGLPPYVTDRLDDPPPDARPGDTSVLLDYYATKGALLQSVQLNGHASTASVLAVDGHAVFRMSVELPRGTTQTIVLHLQEPEGSGTPEIWRQPGVAPLPVEEFNQRC